MQPVPGSKGVWHGCQEAQVAAQQSVPSASPCQDLSAASWRAGKWPLPALPAVPAQLCCSQLLSHSSAEHHGMGVCQQSCTALPFQAQGGSHEVDWSPKRDIRSKGIWWGKKPTLSWRRFLRSFPCAHLCGNYLLLWKILPWQNRWLLFKL